MAAAYTSLLLLMMALWKSTDSTTKLTLPSLSKDAGFASSKRKENKHN
jgi:hypothetical protein